MDPKELRGLMEAYSEVYSPKENIEEGLRSAVKRLLGGGKKETEAPKPQSRGDQLRARYNVGPEGSDTSVKRAIINRSRDNATRAQAQVDRGNASQSYADKAKGAVDSYLKAGYSKYGAGEGSGGQGGSGGRGGGHAARRRAEKLNNSYDLFDYMMEYLIDEGYADTNENALVIMANMSEEWRESIVEEIEQLDEISDKRVIAARNELAKRTNRSVSALSRRDSFIQDTNREGRMNAKIQARNQRTGSNVEPTFIRRHQ